MFEPRTVVIMLILGHLFSALLAIAYLVQNKNERYLNYFLISRLFDIIGWTYFAVNSHTVSDYTAVMGNIFLFLASSFQVSVILILNNRYTKRARWFLVSFIFMMITGTIIATITHGQVLWRLIVFTSCLIGIWTLPIYYLIQGRTYSLLRCFIGLSYCFNLLLQIFQIVLVIVDKLVIYPNRLVGTMVSNVAAIGVYLTMFAGNIGVILMSKERSFSLIANAAKYDDLTGALNRRSFINSCEEIISRNQKSQRHLSMMILDIDDFKKINDDYGHITGDDVLRQFVYQIESILSHRDVLGRIGGEEFMIMLPDIELSEAIRIADSIRNMISNTIFPNDINITTSIGVVTVVPDENTTFSKLYELADIALYRAKNDGKDKTVVADPTIIFQDFIGV